jgi:hypothetical protein
MIEEYGIDDKRDKSRGITRMISGFQIKNSQIVVRHGMIIADPVLIRVLRSRFELPDGKGCNRHRRPGHSDLR